MNPDLDQIVADIRLVAHHVARHPQDFIDAERKAARLVLTHCDMLALGRVLGAVASVASDPVYQPLSPAEQRVVAAAERLECVLDSIRQHQEQIATALQGAA